MNIRSKLVEHIRNLPVEVQNEVFDMVKNSDASLNYIYQKEQKTVYTYLPTTMPVKFVRFDLQDVAEQPQDDYIPHISMNIRKNSHKIFCESLIKTDSQTCFMGHALGDHLVFDGVNNKNKGVLFIYSKISNSFFSYCMCKTKKNDIQIRWAAFCGAGYPVSCTLDYATNQFLLLKKDHDTCAGELCTIHPQRYSFEYKTNITFPYSVEKIVSFGSNIYGLLTHDGFLKTLVYDTTFNLLSTVNQNHGNLRFKHIAVNPTYTNGRNFRPRFALLTMSDKQNQADLYVCDLRLGEKPILMLAHTVHDADRIKYFYYSGAYLKLVYGDEHDSMVVSHNEKLHDNFDLLLAKLSMRKKFLSQYSEAMAITHKRKAEKQSDDEPIAKRTRYSLSNLATIKKSDA